MYVGRKVLYFLRYYRLRSFYRRNKGKLQRLKVVCITIQDGYFISIRISRKRYGMHSFNNKRLRKIKLKFYEAQLGYCRYCVRHFKIEDLTFDHLTPRSKQGSNKQENLILCCQKCNNLKGMHTLEEYKVIMQRRVDRRNAMLSRGFALDDKNMSELAKVLKGTTNA